MATHGRAITAALYEHQNKLQQYTDLEEILLCLKKKGIIKNDEYHEMMELTKEKKKNQVLFILKKISSAGDNAFLALLECLKAKQRDLAEAMLVIVERIDEPYAKELRNSKWLSS